ncbi:MAG: polysaccharide deacetylase family protein, partial [Spirochaetales bacterium]|nr:polysaccharide deacetylase family protein [Spirochaetales bacterium]
CLALGGISGAQISFDSPDLSAENLLLFEVRTDSPHWGAHDTLFVTDLETRSLAQLTHFPERLTYLAGMEVLQLQNRFGVFHSDATLGNFRPSLLFPSFIQDQKILQGGLSPVNASPNGRYLLYLEGRSPAFGELYFIDLDGGERYRVSEGIAIDLAATPALWAPDSSFFVYSKNGTIYYMSVRQLTGRSELPEEYRQIGEGRIGNMSPGGRNSLYYLKGSLVYELDSAELFTRALYRGYLDIGHLVGKIPFPFDPNFDSFWISPEGTHILLNKGGRNLFLYLLSTEDFSSTGDSRSLPYLYLPRNSRITRVLWDGAGTLTVLSSGAENGEARSQVFRIQSAGMASNPAFDKLDLQGVQDILLSPDNDRAAVVFPDRVAVHDYQSWEKIEELRHARVLRAAWVSREQLAIAGANTIELYTLGSAGRRLLGVSQPEAYSFSAREDAVIVSAGQQSYRLNLGDLPAGQGEAGAAGWIQSPAAQLRRKINASESFRVYLEQTPDRVFHNMLMIRDKRRLVTDALVDEHGRELEPFPEAGEPVDFTSFDHGSRIRRREIALVFNVVDSVEGLPAILAALREFNLRCTFFVNGEAIRSYPDAVREIARSGHEVGSLFSTYFDMTDARFRLDKEFIKRGMAANEDEYHAATGKELSLLWHAPHYFVSSDILEASREMNYVYVGRDVDPLDWVTREMSATTRNIYLPAAILVERVIREKKPGSIVPILVGKPQGTREDYLFHRLDVLIDALIKRGYTIVPVSVLIEHAE